jgi:ABC-2 type transport system ATP-binding protein
MIITECLKKKFKDFVAVDEISLQVEAGEVLALLGPNGAGKTTTVRMLTSVLKPTSGQAWIAGYDVVSQAPQVRASVGILTEQHGLYGRMRADEYLDFYGQLYNMSVQRRELRIENLLTDFGLIEDRQRHIGEYSKGMRQKLALARALLHDPPVLLLDEPTSAMDPESARLVRDSIHGLRSEKRAIVICTHNLAEAEELADHIAIIRRGKIVAKGSPQALKQELLGPIEYEVLLAGQRNGQDPELPTGIRMTSHGPDWFRYWVDEPRTANPLLLRALIAQGYEVIGLHEVPRSLEQVYLQAINAIEQEPGDAC